MLKHLAIFLTILIFSSVHEARVLKYSSPGTAAGSPRSVRVNLFHASEIHPLKYPPSGPNPGPPHTSHPGLIRVSKTRSLKYAPSEPPHLASLDSLRVSEADRPVEIPSSIRT